MIKHDPTGPGSVFFPWEMWRTYIWVSSQGWVKKPTPIFVAR
jgi:hypothetical protein